jgi:hypothetical protein
VILYRPRREDEVLDGIVAFVWDDVQSEEVTIEAHEGLGGGFGELRYRLDSESTALSSRSSNCGRRYHEKDTALCTNTSARPSRVRVYPIWRAPAR